MFNMAHANDDHNKAEAYHHMAGKNKKAHEGSQSMAPGKQDPSEGSGSFNGGGAPTDEAY